MQAKADHPIALLTLLEDMRRDGLLNDEDHQMSLSIRRQHDETHLHPITLVARQGYAVPSHGELDQATRNVIAALQMKYRPARYDGEPDAETAALLLVLNRQQ